MKLQANGPVFQNSGTVYASVAVALGELHGRCIEMRITDYESTRNLNDVGLVLTRDEAEELYIYLHKMLDKRELRKAFLSEYHGCGIERELTVTIEENRKAIQLSA